MDRIRIVCNKNLKLFTTSVLMGMVSLFLLPVAMAKQPIIETPYHEVGRYEIGGDGFWDYLTCDSANHRLYVTRGSHVVVISTDTGKTIGDISGFKGCHGVALAPDLKRGYISAGGDNAITIFDTTTLKTIKTVNVGEKPDAILYDSFSKRVFTFNAGTKDTTAIDAVSGKVVGTLPLGGKPEFAQTDKAGNIFVNNEDTSELITFMAKTLKIVRKTSLAPGEGPSGLAFDVKGHKLFACCGNKYAAVVDSKTGKLIATPAIGEGPDAAEFDPGTGWAFTSNGTGTLSILKPGKQSNSFTVESVPTQQGARTMALDARTHRIYLAAAKFEPKAEGERWPKMVPGSFVILVYGTK